MSVQDRALTLSTQAPMSATTRFESALK